MKPSPESAAYHYVGEELELFQHAEGWKSYWSSQIRPYLRGRVLEVGAGLGANTRLLRGAHAGPWLCLEPDPSLLERLRERIAGSPAPELCEARCGGLEAVAADERFETILYVDVLEHIEDDRGELERASRLLDPGGHLIVLSPAHQSLYSPFDEAIGHFRRYDRKTLAAITPPGLEPPRLFYLDAAGLLASLANRTLLRQSLPTRRQLRVWDRFLIPLSKLADPVLGHSLGKTVVGIWQRPAAP